MEYILLVVTVLFGIINGWFMADTYNKAPFTEYDKRGIYNNGFVVVLILGFFSFAPAVAYAILVNFYYALSAFVVTFVITRLCGKYFLKKRIEKRQAEGQKEINKRFNGDA